MRESKLIEIFCSADDFCLEFIPLFEERLLNSGAIIRQRDRSLDMSEMLTIVIFYHQCRFRHFKHYYIHFVQVYLKDYFPDLPSYSRMIQYMPHTLVPLLAFLKACCLGTTTGKQFVDSSPLVVCHNRRIHTHKTFAGLARRGKTSVGWFFGFKLHLIINDLGEVVSFVISPGNTSDVNRDVMLKLCKGVWGKLFGDKGYISKTLAQELKELGTELITKVRKNMKPKPITLMDRLSLMKRGLIECAIDALKNQAYIEHSRHRSFGGFLINILSAICAYSFEDHKPSAKIEFPFLVNIDPKFLLNQ